MAAKPATDRLKTNPALGRYPVLANLLPAELQIDPSYQRSIEASDSQALIRRIAQHWNWDLCQPLVVARRDNGELFVIDGQHRLAAARLRGDIQQLPAVVLSCSSVADEAATFVHMNRERRPLTSLQVFKAAVASGDTEALAIIGLLADAGLQLSNHANNVLMKVGHICNVGGIQAALRKHGPAVTRQALRALADGFSGQRLQFAGSIYPGLVAICADEMEDGAEFAAARFTRFTELLASRTQLDWRKAILATKADRPQMNFARAGEFTFRQVWADQFAPAAPSPPPRHRSPSGAGAGADLGNAHGGQPQSVRNGWQGLVRSVRHARHPIRGVGLQVALLHDQARG